MELFIDIVTKRIYLFNIVVWNFRKKIGFLVCKKENFPGLQAHRKRGKSACASPIPHHTLNEERSARFTAQPLSALTYIGQARALCYNVLFPISVYFDRSQLLCLVIALQKKHESPSCNKSLRPLRVLSPALSLYLRSSLVYRSV